MNNGWVRIHRKSLKSSIWKKPLYWMVWCWCLLKANYEDNEFPFNGSDIVIKRGQFITGQKKAAKELNCSVQNLKSALKYLKSTNRITTKATNQFTIITIIKYNEYQDKETELTNEITNELTNHQPTTNQRLTTIKKYKNKKNNIYTPDFLKFYEIYPKKVGKPKSFIYWKALSEDERAEIMADIPKRMKDDKWVNGFIKDPERYIKNRQWEDDIIIKGNKAKKLWT